MPQALSVLDPGRQRETPRSLLLGVVGLVFGPPHHLFKRSVPRMALRQERAAFPRRHRITPRSGGACAAALVDVLPAMDRDLVSTFASIVPRLASGPVAGLFPGQGSQTPRMRDAVKDVVPELLERCEQLVGDDPFARVGESTRFAQPAIYCASIASWVALEQAIEAGRLDESWRPSVYAGHSLGEIAALVAARSITAQAGLTLAVRRGELMAQAGERDGGGGLVALLGASEEQWRVLADEHQATVANDNAPGQLVLAGSKENLRALVGHAREMKVRAIALDVAGAFHSEAMAPAVEPFRDLLEEIEISTPRVSVISSASGKPIMDVRSELAQGIVSPVRWRETMLRLSEGAGQFLDLGPGKVLAGLVARNLPEARGMQAAELIDGAGRVEVAA
jgi:[acyl-carrier-protein] S-malonyltransferase